MESSAKLHQHLILQFFLPNKLNLIRHTKNKQDYHHNSTATITITSVKTSIEIKWEIVTATSIALEMEKVRNAFELYNGDPLNLRGYKPVGTHLIFDIKLGKIFCRKVRCVRDGHRTETPSSVTYSPVVLKDSVQIVILIAALNDLDIKCTMYRKIIHLSRTRIW